MERLPLQEQIDTLEERVTMLNEFNESMFRNLEKATRLVMGDPVLSVEVMKQLSENVQGLIQYTTDKKDSLIKRNTNKYTIK